MRPIRPGELDQHPEAPRVHRSTVVSLARQLLDRCLRHDRHRVPIPLTLEPLGSHQLQPPPGVRRQCLVPGAEHRSRRESAPVDLHLARRPERDDLTDDLARGKHNRETLRAVNLGHLGSQLNQGSELGAVEDSAALAQHRVAPVTDDAVRAELHLRRMMQREAANRRCREARHRQHPATIARRGRSGAERGRDVGRRIAIIGPDVDEPIIEGEGPGSRAVRPAADEGRRAVQAVVVP